MIRKDIYKIDGFELLHLSGAKHSNASNGIACYVKDKYKDYVRVYSNSDKNNLYTGKNDLEITLIALKLNEQTVYVMSLYKHPDQSFKDFWEAFKKYLRDNFKSIEQESTKINLFILGDFNINADKETQLKEKILQKFNFKFLYIVIILYIN
jgi:hypothetical protein